MSETFDRLVAVMSRLRGEDGCPWDREQDHHTLKAYVLEEAYEVLEAIESGRAASLKEELGDLLFQVIFHAQIAKENGVFDIEAVLTAIVDKMIHRHPHVFSKNSRATKNGEGQQIDSADVLARWEDLKKSEPGNHHRKSALDGVPLALPALLRAQKIQSRAARVGFDWPYAAPVRLKIDEELGELEEAVDGGEQARIESELGDLLFSIVNYARFLKVNSEDALRGAMTRFTERFQDMESQAEAEGVTFDSLSLDEMNRLWEKAKVRARF